MIVSIFFKHAGDNKACKEYNTLIVISRIKLNPLNHMTRRNEPDEQEAYDLHYDGNPLGFAGVFYGGWICRGGYGETRAGKRSSKRVVYPGIRF